MYQASVIDIINTQIRTNTLCDSRFAGASILGIAYDGTELQGTVVRSFPVVFDLHGEGVKVNPDDTYPLQIYHRILNKSYQVKPASVGDRANVISERTDAKMVVAGWTNRLSMTQEDLEALLASNFPDQIAPALYTPLRLLNLVVTLQSTVLDRAQVYREEYRGLPYQVRPEQILLSIRYQIESTYRKGCFIITDCQPAGVLPL